MKQTASFLQVSNRYSWFSPKRANHLLSNCILSLSLVAVGMVPVQATEVERVSGANLAEAMAPEPSVAANTRVGQAISINGSIVSAPWIQTDGRTAVADFVLNDHLGAVFLNTSIAGVQPIQWFSRQDQLTSTIDSGYRFLDITEIVHQQNWTINPQGTTLQITTPIHQIQSIQRETHFQGERITIFLTGDTVPLLTEGVGEFSLNLSATANSNVLSGVPLESTHSILRSLTLTPAGSSTLLRGQIAESARPIVSTLSNPSRIIIDVRQDFLQPKDIVWAPGVRWRQQYIPVGTKQFPVYWLQIDPRQAHLALRPIWTDPITATGITPLQTMAQRWQAAAAINAGFFNRNNQTPLGAVRYDSEWISGPILSRGVVGWNQNGQVAMSRVFLQQTLTTSGGQSFPIQALNSGYVQAGIGLYTPTWGPDYRPILENEIVLTVVDGRVVDQRSVVASNPPSFPIPDDGFVLAMRSFATAARSLPPGTEVQIQSELIPAELSPFPNVVGGGPLLLQNGNIVLNAELEKFSRAFATQAAPRSAIGFNSAGELLLVAVHHSPTGPGPSLQELAQIMVQLGSIDALNLDGGSSASLYLGGRLLNRNPRTAARVNNGIGLFLE
jgi:exopolysaccharide biosynthesis protein